MRLVVDSSVWIDYFNGAGGPHTASLERAFSVCQVLVGDIVLAEVLQGFRSEADFRQTLDVFGRFEVVPMLGRELAVETAQNYRRLRKAGVTVRKTLDVAIGTWCIAHRLPLLYSDRDFEPMVKHLGLIAYP